MLRGQSARLVRKVRSPPVLAELREDAAAVLMGGDGKAPHPGGPRANGSTDGDPGDRAEESPPTPQARQALVQLL